MSGRHKYKKVILIIADTLRSKNVGVYGRNPSPTPNIDKLAHEGILFTNAYCGITKTDPSISSIMTGKYPASLGIVNHAQNVNQDEESALSSSVFLAEIFKSNGFKTAAVDWLGRWHKRGFSYYSGKIKDEYGKKKLTFDFNFTKKPLLFYLRLAGKVSVKFTHRDYFTRLYFAFAKDAKVPYDTADVVVKKGIELLKKNKKKPLFLYLHLWDTHEPHSRSYGLKSYLFDDVEKTYEDELSFMDGEIGKLLEHLKKTGEDKNTLIVFTADHGENFYESGSPFNHDYLYENVVKVPLIFNGKGLAGVEDGPIRHVDILPLICKFTGLKMPRGLDGNSNFRSKKTVFFEDIARERRLKFLNNTRKRGARVGKYKYIETLKGADEEVGAVAPSENLKVSNREIYNLEKDPFERINLFEKQKKLGNDLSYEFESITRELDIKRMDAKPEFRAKVEKSLKTIKSALKKYPSKKIALAWTGGKDSTVLLHMVKLAFNGKIPFRIIFNDSTMEFDEIYEFVDRIKKEWSLDLITIKHSKKELAEFDKTADRERKKELSRLMKITAINSVVKKYKFKALIAGIRWDEHESRSKEKYFSKRKNHIRVHPILHLTEADIWEYIHFFGVPYVNLYKKGYRSLGEKPFTKPAKEGEGERSGREREKEQLMANLRKLGYW